MEQIVVLIVLILSIVLHEVAHGHAANWLGDPTARLQGRLSMNPIRHVDPLGSVIIPAFLVLTNSSLLFGWAKPVPYNPYNLNNQKWGEAIVAAAGPAVNILLAIIFAVLIRLAPTLGLAAPFVELSYSIVLINVLLAMFNMIPIPPLDGSKILMAILPLSAQQGYRNFTMKMERMGLFGMFAFIFIFMFLFARPFFDFVYGLVNVLTGL